MKIVSIVGARPEFIQVWPLRVALSGGQHEILVHTGQHYDYEMSKLFFEELDIPEPAYNLGVGSGSHAKQTAEILVRLEEILLTECPDLVIVLGDTNSTLGGALTAAKLEIPVAHVEAGERSFNRTMPEEINRIVTDALSSLHFCASQNAVGQLAAEGIQKNVFWTGDVMYDAFLKMMPIAREQSRILNHLNLTFQGFSLVTVHRAGNIYHHARLVSILEVLNRIDEEVVFPVHPYTRNAISKSGYSISDRVRVIDPVGYLDMLELERNARLIATDSGGVQREAYFHKVPCLTLREETEWTETVEAGWNRLVGIEPEQVLAHWDTFEEPSKHPALFGDGRAAERIVRLIDGWAKSGFSTPLEGFVPDELLPLETAGVTQ